MKLVESDSIVNDGIEAYYCKYQCAFPMRKCQVFLIYKYEVQSGKSVVFSTYLMHNHSLGPIKWLFNTA